MNDLPPVTTLNALAYAVAAITAIGALGTAAAGLVDATKALYGGLSMAGLRILNRTLKTFDCLLSASGVEWKAAVRANWINGMPKADQKAYVMGLLRLGMTTDSGKAFTPPKNINAAVFAAAADALFNGTTLTPEQLAVLGRFNDGTAAKLDAAFESADQLYRNVCRLAAGFVSVALAVWAGALLKPYTSLSDLRVGGAILAGLLAVPLAPIAKDLASSLQAAAKAVKPQ